MLHRSQPMTRSPMAHATLKPKVCAYEKCGREFVPTRPMQQVCGPTCAGRKIKAEKAAKERAERESFKARKEAIKRIPDLIREADKAFAEFIRERDRLAGHACISSGKPLDWSGNQVDAGHYRSRGAASHLRYHEDNCHAQTKRDNQFKAGNVVEYRIRLIARIGLARVEALEADNSVHHWTREELIAIRAEYRQRLKQLKESRK
jgi:hypothetical protein